MLTNCQCYAAKMAPNTNGHTFQIIVWNIKIEDFHANFACNKLENIKPHYLQITHFKTLRDIFS